MAKKPTGNDWGEQWIAAEWARVREDKGQGAETQVAYRLSTRTVYLIRALSMYLKRPQVEIVERSILKAMGAYLAQLPDDRRKEILGLVQTMMQTEQDPTLQEEIPF